MNQIKFSHIYTKWVQRNGCYRPPLGGTLIQIFIIDKKKIHPSFEVYDTEYADKNGHGYYGLPNGKLIVLLFDSINSNFKNSVHIWTTIRRWTKEKEKYYRSKIGEDFEIVVMEEIE